MFLARFWAFIFILFAFGDSLIWILNMFYSLFIRGRSKSAWRKLIEDTIAFQEVLSVNHTVFAAGNVIALIFHVSIIRYMDKISPTGIIALLLFAVLFVMGIVYKYIYREESIKRYHKRIAALMWIFIIIHIAAG